MEVNRSDVLIYGVFLCCFLIVLGGLAFLMLGAMRVKKRQKSADGNVLSVEFRGLKLKTDFPAIGITICGLFFALLAAWMDHNGTMVVRVSGHLDGPDAKNVQLFAAVPLQQVTNPGTGDILDDVAFVLGQDTIYIVPVVPGHPGPTMRELEPPTTFFERFRRVNLGEFRVSVPSQAVLEMPAPSATLVTAPTPDPGSEKRKGY